MLNIIKKHHRKIILTAPLLFLLVHTDYIPNDNGVFLKPSTYFPEVGVPFSINLNFSSNSVFNATDGIINFASSSISINKIDTTSSSIDLWGGTPEWSNESGVITWSGGIISPQITNGKQQGLIFKVIATANKSAPGIISIKESSMLAANGKADNIIKEAVGIRIYPRPRGTPSPDFDNDRIITVKDISQVMIGVGKKYNPKIDINGDKTINYKDVSQMIVYYNESNK